jgi:hypothetical protein
MGCGDACPLVRARRREVWNMPGPKDLSDAEFGPVCGLIKRKVKQLLRSL